MPVQGLQEERTAACLIILPLFIDNWHYYGQLVSINKKLSEILAGNSGLDLVVVGPAPELRRKPVVLSERSQVLPACHITWLGLNVAVPPRPVHNQLIVEVCPLRVVLHSTVLLKGIGEGDLRLMGLRVSLVHLLSDDVVDVRVARGIRVAFGLRLGLVVEAGGPLEEELWHFLVKGLINILLL